MLDSVKPFKSGLNTWTQRELLGSVGRNVESIARKYVGNRWTSLGGNQHRGPGTSLRQMLREC